MIITDIKDCTKNKFSIKDFFNKCDQILRKLWIWSHLLKKSLMENFIFCALNFFGNIAYNIFQFIIVTIIIENYICGS